MDNGTVECSVHWVAWIHLLWNNLHCNFAYIQNHIQLVWKIRIAFVVIAIRIRAKFWILCLTPCVLKNECGIHTYVLKIVLKYFFSKKSPHLPTVMPLVQRKLQIIDQNIFCNSEIISTSLKIFHHLSNQMWVNKTTLGCTLIVK